jgi:hypothetical protein
MLPVTEPCISLPNTASEKGPPAMLIPGCSNSRINISLVRRASSPPGCGRSPRSSTSSSAPPEIDWPAQQIDSSYDVAFVSTFKNVDGCRAYFEDERHQRIAGELRDLSERIFAMYLQPSRDHRGLQEGRLPRDHPNHRAR